MNLQYIVTNPNYLNIKQVLKEEFYISDKLILKLKKNEKIMLNGKSTYVNHLVNLGDNITVTIDFVEDNSNIIPKKMNLDIIYEDDALLIINKPANLPVHP